LAIWGVACFSIDIIALRTIAAKRSSAKPTAAKFGEANAESVIFPFVYALRGIILCICFLRIASLAMTTTVHSVMAAARNEAGSNPEQSGVYQQNQWAK
jgi:hypothetical protein